MTLAAPENLALGLLVLGIAGALFWLERWRRRVSRAFGGTGQTGDGVRFPLQAALILAGAAVLVIAAARPYWGTRDYTHNREGVDVVVVLDVSQSMTAQDVKPSRLGVAEEDVAHLIEALRGNRVGLVFFAGSPILRSPLSTDTGALAEIVRKADRTPGLVQPGSDIGAALDQAGRILDASQSPGKAVVLISDGEDFGTTAVEKARALRDKGVVVFTAGTGTAAGSTLLDAARGRGQPQVKIDPATGQPVVTRLNEGSLQAVAAATGGGYMRLTGSGRDLQALRTSFAQLQQAPFGADSQRVPAERFQWFAAAGLLMLAAAWFVPAAVTLKFLRPMRRPRLVGVGLAVFLVAMFLTGACGGSNQLRDDNAVVNELYARGDFEGATAAYEKLLSARPDIPELAYNAGNALDRAGKFDRAVTETQRALPPIRPSLGVATYYSLGNHYLALGRLQDAFEAYRSALLLDPHDGDAKVNIEIVLSRMAQQPPSAQGQGPGQSATAPSNPDQQGPNAAQQPDQPSASQPDASQPGAAAANAQRDLQEALAGLQDNITFEDAVRILNLLDQLNANQRRSQPQPGQAGRPDY